MSIAATIIIIIGVLSTGYTIMIAASVALNCAIFGFKVINLCTLQPNTQHDFVTHAVKKHYVVGIIICSPSGIAIGTFAF